VEDIYNYQKAESVILYFFAQS